MAQHFKSRLVETALKGDERVANFAHTQFPNMNTSHSTISSEQDGYNYIADDDGH